MARAQIGLTVSNDEIIHIEGAATAREAWTNICGVYEAKGLASIVFLRKKLYSIKKSETETMQKHINNIKEVVSKLSAVGVIISDQDLAMILLCSLPKDYETLTVSLESRPAAELTSEFVINRLLAEEERKTNTDSNSSSDTRISAFYSSQNRNRNGSSSMRRSGNEYENGRPICNYCHKPGHIEKQCYSKHGRPNGSQSYPRSNNSRAYQATVQNAFWASSSNMNSSSQHSTQMEWYIDSGASVHSCNNIHYFHDYHHFTDKRYICLGDDTKVRALGSGSILIQVQVDEQWVPILVKNVWYAPEMVVNLISIYRITMAGLKVMFDGPLCSVLGKNGNKIAVGKRIASKGLWRLDVRYDSKDESTNAVALMSDGARSNTSFKLWHDRLGHLSLSGMNSLVQKQMASGIDYVETAANTEVTNCIGCIKGKTHRSAVAKNTSFRATMLLELIHIDCCGPMRTKSLGGSRYFITFIDDYSRWTVVRTMKHKDEAIDHFFAYKAYVENLTNQRIRAIRTDNGGEFVSNAFDQALISMGIAVQRTPPYTPQLNGVAERANRSIVERARSMLYAANLDHSFWCEAVCTAVYLKNRSPTKALDNVTPYELWHGKKPSLDHLRTFGCKAYSHISKERRGKLDAKALECIFIGYTESSQIYRLYDPVARMIYESRDVKFIEESGMPISGSDLLLNGQPEVIDAQNSQHNSDNVMNNEISSNDATDDDVLDISSFESREEQKDEHVQAAAPQQSSTSSLPARASRMSPRNHSSTQALNAARDVSVNQGLDSRSSASPLVGSVVPLSESSPSTMSFSQFTNSLSNPNINHALIASSETTDPLEPTNYTDAMNRNDRIEWEQAIQDEFDSILAANTWTLVDLPPDREAIKCKWIFKLKRNAHGEIDRYKARLVAKGFSQKEGIDYNDTFAPVVKFTSIRLLLAFGAYYDLEIHQLDVKTAFLNGNLEENIYMEQPEGFAVKGKEHLVCKLNKSIYGLKQASRQWYQKIDSVLINMYFARLESDHCVYYAKMKDVILLVALYVDDIIILSNSLMKLESLKKELSQLFAMKDLGEIHFILGIRIERNRKNRTISLSQSEYVKNIVTRYGMIWSKTASTPLDVGVKLSKKDSITTADETSITEQHDNYDSSKYQSALGAVMYAMIATRPDISFAVTALSQFSKNPGNSHWLSLKRLLKYLKGTMNFKLVYGAHNYDRPIEKHSAEELITGFCDADWGSNIDDRRSITGYIFLFNGSAISWKSKKQPSVALSSVEAEYMSASQATREAVWLKRFLHELNIATDKPISIACDSQGAIAVAKNPEYHARTKHIDIQHHYVREKVEDNTVAFHYTPTTEMIADILTKAVNKNQHEKLTSLMGLTV